MALDSNSTPPCAPGVPGEPPSAEPSRPVPLDKVRLRFRKQGPLRLLSHHDLLRTFERLLRRAGVPFHRTQGFHPKPRLIFALSLPLGVIGRDEVAEIELTRIIPPAELLDLLVRHAPPGLEIVTLRRVPLKTTAHVHSLSYALPLPPECLDGLLPRIAAVLAAETCWIDRSRRILSSGPEAGGGTKRDLRPFLRDLRLVEEGSPLFPAMGLGHDNGRSPRTFLVMDLWLTNSGTARPEEVLRLVNLQNLLDAGAVLERVRLELTDELVPPSADAEPPRPVPVEGS